MISKVFLLCLLPSIVYADIRTTTVDLLLNSRHHHTDKYADAIKDLIVRRGDNITLTVEVEGSNVDPIKVWIRQQDELVETFMLGQSRDIDLSTNFSSDISSIEADLNRNTTKLQVKIWIPSKSAIGETVMMFTQGTEEDSFHKINAFVLFNPWCKSQLIVSLF